MGIISSDESLLSILNSYVTFSSWVILMNFRTNTLKNLNRYSTRSDIRNSRGLRPWSGQPIQSPQSPYTSKLRLKAYTRPNLHKLGVWVQSNITFLNESGICNRHFRLSAQVQYSKSNTIPINNRSSGPHTNNHYYLHTAHKNSQHRTL